MIRPLLPVALLLVVACTDAYQPHNPPPSPAPRAPRVPTQVQGDAVVDLTPQGETAEGAVAISPRDARIVIAAGIRRQSNEIRFVDYFRSTDAGQTWSARQTLPLIASGRTLVGHFDPVLAFDRSGTAYLTVMGMVTPLNWTVVVFRSTDAGATWVGIDVSRSTSGLVDKPWLAVDRSGTSTDGALHVVWFAGGLRVATSRDGGFTWTTPHRFTTFGSPWINTGPNGEVYVSHLTSPTELSVMRSDDGGVTFGAPVKFADQKAKLGGQLGVTAFPQMAADLSFKATRGNLYAVFVSAEEGPNGVMLVRSTDRGQTWSAPVRLSGPANLNRDAAFPALDVDVETGEVVVAWLDCKDDANNQLARLYAGRSLDGGVTFDTRAFTNAFDPTRGSFMGDYNQVATHRGRRVAVFTDGAGHLLAAQLDYGDPPREPVSGVGRRRAARH